MNILQVYNQYRTPGGEWTVLNQEFELLKESHEVDQLVVDNREQLSSFYSRLRLIFNTHYNRDSKRWFYQKLMEKSYDIIHVHNFFPLLSPSIFDAARDAGVPTVMTLHNYRLIHPNGLMYYKGRIDERSVEGSAYRCVADGVYRNSVLQTAVTAHMIEYHRRKGTWNSSPTAFIALSEFSKGKFVKGGLPEKKIFSKPNFIRDPLLEFEGLKLSEKKKKRILYVGRISHEKGVQEMIRCWLKYEIPVELWIVGDGPMREKLQKSTENLQTVKWVGTKSRKEIFELLSESLALLFPTLWYEGMPIVLLEALAMGCPVISSEIGNPMAMIEHGKNGILFEPGNIEQLYGIISGLLSDPSKLGVLGKNARATYIEKYTPSRNYEQLMEIYENARQMESKRT
ncbi:MAG: glycosyltransferase family 1 protein [Balneolaceae bacterium]|nr:MAG: glycosyltransferase family 1 protein [Balneolaceae bacterium]